MEKSKEKIYQEKTYFCDFCGAECCKGYGIYEECTICGRDCCSKHSKTSPDQGLGDDFQVICIECWDIAKPYFEKIKNINDECYEKEKEIRKTMTDKCLRNMKDKN